MKSVFAYIRVSTVKQGMHGSSLQEQRAAIEGYAARHSLRIIEWFEEQETAAKRGRPHFGRMVKLLQGGRGSGVIIHKIDRGARNLRDWADLGELIDRGVEVHFAHESLDLTSRGGRLAADIQAVVAADWIRNHRHEVVKGFYGRLKQGLYPLPAPVGYLDQGGGKPKVPDPDMAPIIRRTFELYATGRYNIIQLGEEAYRLGLRNRRGGRVVRSSLSTILNNEFYIGIISLKQTGERFTGAHEPLVSTKLFALVRELLHGRTVQRELKHHYLFRKLIRCASCGYFLSGERQKGHIYYRCHTPACPSTCLREEALSVQMQEALTLLRLPSNDYAAFAAEFAHECERREGSLAEQARLVQIRNGKITERLTTLTDAYLDGTIERDLFLERKAALLFERAEIEETLARLRANDDPEREEAEKIFEPLRRLNSGENTPVAAEMREMVKSLTSNLLMESKKLLFEWKTGLRPFVDWAEHENGGPSQTALRTFPLHHTRQKRPYVSMSTKQLVDAMFQEQGKNEKPRLAA